MNQPIVISILALAVSVSSLGVAFASFWRAYLAEQPIAWLELRPTATPNDWTANIHLRNQSRFGWKPIHAIVPLDMFPVTDKQKFLLASISDGVLESLNNEAPEEASSRFNIKVNFAYLQVEEITPGKNAVIPILLRRGRLSNASTVKVTFLIQSVTARPRLKRIILKAQLPGASSMQLQ